MAENRVIFGWVSCLVLAAGWPGPAGHAAGTEAESTGPIEPVPVAGGYAVVVSKATHDGARVIIGPLARATDAMAGRIGTRITKG